MTKGEFQSRMKAAMALRELNVGAQDFWAGYMRGLRRLYHGENFGMAEEHKQWLSLIDDPIREEMWRGYRDGLAGRT